MQKTIMQKTMTNVEQQDARLIAMDEAVVAAIRLHAPNFEAAYLADDLPRWFQDVLDHCTTMAEAAGPGTEHVADRTDAAFIKTLSALLGHALGVGFSLPMILRSCRNASSALPFLHRITRSSA
jgi:hypothetical protein